MDTRTMIVAFVDLTGYAKQVARVGDEQVADTLDAYYERLGAGVGAGRVIKVIGDGALLAWPEGAADAAVTALADLKADIDAWLASRGWPCELIVKAHIGPVRAGDFGPIGDKRFDILGATVNDTARLRSTGVAVSSALHALLSPPVQSRVDRV